MDEIAEIRAAGLEVIPTIAGVTLLAPLPEFWEAFQTSEEFQDNKADPMDRYSKRIISKLADRLGIEAVFPSDGPPYPPFVEWAEEADGVFPSPIGLFVHTEFGLWISFRGALLAGLVHAPYIGTSPCLNCVQPCKTACPVGAFAGGYNVEKCREYLRSGDVDCWDGCLARRVCPAAKLKRDPAQSRFHMQAFVGDVLDSYQQGSNSKGN